MRTRVCITIDTEFSIGGAFTDAAKRPVAEPLVLCNVGERSEGLGFMLDTFRQYGVTATFFVETLHRYYFKNDPMAPIARRLHEQGHEVQLHLHPCWTLFQHEDWWDRSRGKKGRDDFEGRGLDDSVALFEQGFATFREWGLPAPLVFRSGNLQHDATLYQAMAKAGIPYASNVATAIYDSGDPDFKLYSGQHERHGVREFPVLTFVDWSLGGKQHTKSLTIAGSSFAETRRLLEQAHQAGIELVVILTHPFEFVQNLDLAFAQTQRNSMTQSRLTSLCKFLSENQDRFDACGLAAAAAALPAVSTANTLLKGVLWQTLPRMAMQVAHQKIGRWILKRKFGKGAKPGAASAGAAP